MTLSTEIGTFEVKSGAMIVTDPSYDIGKHYQGMFLNVQKGTWNASVEQTSENNENHYNKEIQIMADSISPHTVYFWEEVWGQTIGVDSGMVGFFDLESYQKVKINEDGEQMERDVTIIEHNAKQWYQTCCDQRNSSNQAGIVDTYGVVTASGHGDGVYPLAVAKKADGTIIGFRLQFIEEEETDTCENCGITYVFAEGDGNYCSHSCREDAEENEEER